MARAVPSGNFHDWIDLLFCIVFVTKLGYYWGLGLRRDLDFSWPLEKSSSVSSTSSRSELEMLLNIKVGKICFWFREYRPVLPA